MSRAAAFRFLCGCLARDTSPVARDALLRAASCGSFGWEIVVCIANETLVAPAVLDALRRKDMLEAVPPDVIDFFNGIAVLNRQRNERLLVEATDFAAILNALDVVPVFLKGGAHLISGLYTNPAHRVMVDLDVLVPADRLSDCVAALHAEGYAALTDADFSGHHHYPPLGRPGTIAVIELHDEPLDRPWRRLLAPAEIFAGAVVLERGPARLAVPSGRCRVIHSVAHAQLADLGYLYGDLGLRELLDLVHLEEAFRHELDWTEIAGRFSQCGATTAFEFHLLAASRLLSVRLEPDMRVSRLARALVQRAEWQAGHAAWSRVGTRVLRPLLLLRRSLSDAVLRRRLFRSLGDSSWYGRQWRMLRG